MLFIIGIISFLYFGLITTLVIGFDKIKPFVLKHGVKSMRFSILIPFRNEAKNISALAKSLIQLKYHYTNFEVIWINDGSTDQSVEILNTFLKNNNNWKLLENQRKSNSPKKDAINTAINLAKFEWIITTDADCILPKYWLTCFNDFILSFQMQSDYIEENINMIVAPVAYKTNNSFLQNFQNMDFLSLIGSTIGGFGIHKPFLCNGANLCYKKEAFFKVNGFDGNDTIASGDDIFLLEKIANKYPNTVHYLKCEDALVLTKPETNFNNLLTQRIRWASKTSATKNWFAKFIGFVVFLFNLLMVCGLWFVIFNSAYLYAFLFLFLLKFNIDFLLIQKTYRFVNLNNGLKSYIFSSVFYPFFVVLVFVLSLFKKYTWKGRVFYK